MATLRKKRYGEGYYQRLNNISSVILHENRKKKVKTYPNYFEVERIISKRTIDREEQYLIKWKDWPLQFCSWEPATHLTADLLRYYECPTKIDNEKIAEAGRQFYNVVLSCLKSKARAPVYMDMNHDVWRYIVHNKGIPSDHKGHTCYQKQDFSRLTSLPQHWWYYLDQHGQGQAIDFPIKVKPVLTWSPAHYNCEGNSVKPSVRIPLEKLCITIVKRPCNTENVYD